RRSSRRSRTRWIFSSARFRSWSARDFLEVCLEDEEHWTDCCQQSERLRTRSRETCTYHALRKRRESEKMCCRAKSIPKSNLPPLTAPYRPSPSLCLPMQRSRCFC